MNELKNENVSLFYARDEFENYVLIDEINDINKDKDFVCPVCGGVVKPRCLNSKLISKHFYHVNASDCSNESIMHFWYKNEFIVNGDVFYIDDVKYVCKEVLIEQQYNTSFGRYTPDATIVTDENKIIFVEYNYTNKKNTDLYSDMWIELDHPVVEVDIKFLLQSNKKEKYFKSIFSDGVVKHTKQGSRYNIIQKHINDNNIKDRIRIKYLNGFLRDVYRYNSGQLGIEELTIIIDNMNELDLKCIPKLLKSLKCNNVLDEYAKHRCELVDKLIKKYLAKEEQELINRFEKCYNFCFSRKYSIYNSINFKNTLKIIYKEQYCKKIEYGFNIFGKFDFEEIIPSINVVCEKLKMDIMEDKRNQHRIYIINKKEKLDLYMENALLFYINYIKDHSCWYVQSYSIATKNYRGVGRKEWYTNYVIKEYYDLLAIEEERRQREITLSKIHNGIIDYFSHKYYKLDFKYETPMYHYRKNECFRVYNDKLNFERYYDTLNTFNKFNEKLRHTEKSIQLTIDKIKDDILNISPRCYIWNNNILYKNNNKMAYTEVITLEENIFTIKTYIKIEKVYYDDKVINIPQTFIINLNNNSISFTCNEVTKLVYVEDNYDMTMFLKDIELKLKEYCEYYINEILH